MNAVKKSFQTMLFIVSLFVLASSAIIAAGELGPATKDAPLSDKQTSLFNFSLNELLKVGIKNATGFTKINPCQVPVTMTVLDNKDIKKSGARDMELAQRDLHQK